MAGRVAGKVAFITGAAGVRAAVTRSGWPRRAPTSSRSTSARTTRASATAWPPRPTWPRPSRRSRRSTGGSSPGRPTSATCRAQGGRRRGRGRARQARHRLRQRRHLHRAGLGRGDPGGVAGHDRHQPDRRVEHAGGRDPASARQRRRVDHRHELDRGHQGPAVPGALHRRQARRRRHRRSLANELAGTRSGSTRSTRPAWTPRWWRPRRPRRT